ncbi:MAG: DUF1015 domain-containing protein [Clostridia bacterium]|nr:DUF1015 domain-containing protein [Clostridia bacterium]
MIETGIVATNILLPETEDMTAWATIACDQFTSEPEFWNELGKLVSGKRTTLDLTLPEIYLEDNADARIEKINNNITEYINSGVFKTLDKGFILTIRSTPFVKKRIGLVGAVDLEKYEYSQKSEALVRSTEGTIEERIPPRLKIRKNAGTEFPHIMILFDDEKREITERLYENRSKLTKLYDFELNMGGGHIEGYFVPDYNAVLEQFSALLNDARLTAKYGKSDKFAFAVGDGNHSLATAKTHWNNVKSSLSEKERENHPARFALAEFVNIYDEGIYFEAIHRFVTNVDREKFLKGLSNIDGGRICVYDGKENYYNGTNTLPQGIKDIDTYIKSYISENGGAVDYVHGDENIKKLVDANSSSVGILFEKLDKKDLFRYVSSNGAFPRKTFSMGEGIEKRFYLEGRKIVK